MKFVGGGHLCNNQLQRQSTCLAPFAIVGGFTMRELVSVPLDSKLKPPTGKG
jgi:hypothetical protein